jgi:DNA-binding transcriptional ArsR family regulator
LAVVSKLDPSGQEHSTEGSEVRELRAFLRSVGDTLRLYILRYLVLEGETNVTGLADALRASQPLLSWHLGVLKRNELVSVRREGREALYSVNMPVVQEYRTRLDSWLGIARPGARSEERTDE